MAVLLCVEKKAEARDADDDGFGCLCFFLRGEARLKTKKNNFLLDCYRLIAAFISQLIIYYCIMQASSSVCVL